MLDTNTLAVQWSASILELEAEVFGPLGSTGSAATTARRAPPGLYGPVAKFHDGDNSFFQFQLVRGTSAEFPQGGDEIWQVNFPSRKWEKLGPGDKAWTAYAPDGRFGVQFEQDGDDAIICLIVAGERSELVRGDWPLPEAETASMAVILKPDRLFWISKDRRLWTLSIDGGLPNQVWPRPEQTP